VLPEGNDVGESVVSAKTETKAEAIPAKDVTSSVASEGLLEEIRRVSFCPDIFTNNKNLMNTGFPALVNTKYCLCGKFPPIRVELFSIILTSVRERWYSIFRRRNFDQNNTTTSLRPSEIEL